MMRKAGDERKQQTKLVSLSPLLTREKKTSSICSLVGYSREEQRSSCMRCPDAAARDNSVGARSTV